MKKFLDRYLFSRLGLQIAFSVIIILLFSFVGTQVRTLVTNHKESDVYSQTFWGFRQITDGGSMAGTLDDLDMVAEKSGNGYGAPVVLAIALVSWLIGMVLYSFVTGAVVNAFEGRKDKIEGGKARYKFRDHGIVIGWDFQGVASVMAMFDVWKMKEVLVLSEKPSEEIRAELENELDEKTMQKVFVYNGTLGTEVGIDELYPEKAHVIIVLGDRNDFDNDGGNLKICSLLRDKIGAALKEKPLSEEAKPIQVFIDISNTYNLSLVEMYPAEGYVVPKGMEIHIVNFCKATIRELYSSFSQFVEWNSGRRKGLYETSYRPLAFRRNPEATHVHLVVAGVGDMAKAAVLELAPLMGAGRADNVITVFSSDEDELDRFAAAYPFAALQGVCVEFVAADIDQAESREHLVEIVRDATASVTIMVTGDNADETWAMANRLPPEVRFEHIRLLIEQRILSKWAHKTYPVQLSGFGDVAFFGFTDRYFASFGMRVELERRLLSAEPGLKLRDRYFAVSFVDGLLENLTSHGYRFEYNPDKKREALHSIDTETLDGLCRYEHARNVNFQLLHGLRQGIADDDVFKTSATIVPWHEASDALKAKYADKLNRSLAALSELYDRGEYPYVLERDEFRCILGVLPDESVDETPEKRREIRDAVVTKAVRESKWQQPDGNEKSEASVAIVLTPGKGLARQMYRLSFLHSIPMILVLPCAQDRYLASVPESDKPEMERWLRNAYSIIVAEGDVNDEIVAQSNGLIVRDGDSWRVSDDFAAKVG